MDDVRVAAAQYPIEPLSSYGAWEAKISRWVGEGANEGAHLLVFPEYAGMELAGIDPSRAMDLQASLELVMEFGDKMDELHRQLAIHYDVTILGGSRPYRRSDGVIVNRAHMFMSDGSSAPQDKIVMTRFEREIWGVSGGDTVNVIDTPFGVVGIAICYDSEFPLIARRQAEAGAGLILVPSATDSMQGYWRVRIGAQARALENQCYVIQAVTVGHAPWLPSLDDNHGAAAIYGPPDGITPDNGVFAIGKVDQPQWVYADICQVEVGRWRSEGSVLPFTHWPEQIAEVRLHTRVTGDGVDIPALLQTPVPVSERDIWELGSSRIAL